MCGLRQRRRRPHGNLWGNLWSMGNAMPMTMLVPMTMLITMLQTTYRKTSALRPCLWCPGLLLASSIRFSSKKANIAPIGNTRAESSVHFKDASALSHGLMDFIVRLGSYWPHTQGRKEADKLMNTMMTIRQRVKINTGTKRGPTLKKEERGCGPANVFPETAARAANGDNSIR